MIVITLLALTVFLFAVPSKAAEGDWITSYTVRDLSTNEIIMQKSNTGAITSGNLLEGAKLNVTITITVPMTVPDSTLRLSTSMLHSTTQDSYWQLKTLNFPLQSYNPNTPSVTFSQSQGELTISCYGNIPTGLTTSSSGSGTQLHLPKAFDLITLTTSSGQTIDQIKPYVIDSKIAEYITLHDQSANALQGLINQNAAPAYVSLYRNVINGSEAAKAEGFVDNAIAQLNQLVISEQPPVGGSSMFDTLFLPVAGVLAVVAVLGLVLFFRAKSKVGYVSQVVEDQIRDLEGLTLRASRIDKNLSTGLETVEDRLKRAVGA